MALFSGESLRCCVTPSPICGTHWWRIHSYACGVLGTLHLKCNSIVKRLLFFVAQKAHRHIFWIWVYCNFYYSTFVHWTFIERDIGPFKHYRMGYWSINFYWNGLLNIFYCDIWVDIDTICMGYWPIVHLHNEKPFYLVHNPVQGS